jgi:protein tyrosine/serine phosphatase
VLPWTGGNDAIWVNTGVYYTNYLRNRPGNVVAALRTMTASDGATLVHCAAGKDRTGVVCALALSVAGVDRQAIVDDYVQTGERIDAIMSRLKATATYAADLEGRPNDENLPRAESMHAFLDFIDTEFGSADRWLGLHGWTADDTAALRAHLVGSPESRA